MCNLPAFVVIVICLFSFHTCEQRTCLIKVTIVQRHNHTREYYFRFNITYCRKKWRARIWRVFSTLFQFYLRCISVSPKNSPTATIFHNIRVHLGVFHEAGGCVHSSIRDITETSFLVYNEKFVTSAIVNCGRTGLNSGESLPRRPFLHPLRFYWFGESDHQRRQRRFLKKSKFYIS